MVLEQVTENTFLEFGTIFVFGMIFGVLAKKLKQPLIPAYIIAGIALRPFLLNLFHTNFNTISTISEIGIAFMLFSVGLKMEFEQLKIVKNVAIFGGLISTFAAFGVMFVISRMFFLGTIQSIYLATVLCFSSTMVVVKLLIDADELETIHGRIVVGMLILQDIAAIFLMAFLSSNISLFTFIFAFLKALIFIGIIFLISKLIMTPLFRVGAKSQELLLLVAIGICFLFSIIGQYIGVIFMSILNLAGITFPQQVLGDLLSGFSITIGAFLAGLTIASLPYKTEIAAKMVPLKDFFALIFFVTLGVQLKLGSVMKSLPFIFVIVIFTIILKPILTMIAVSLFGYKERISFLSGIPMSQVSEFGFIIAYQGLNQNVISKSLFSIVILSALITISVSSYFVKYHSRIFSALEKSFGFLNSISSSSFSKNRLLPEIKIDPNANHKALLCGYHRIGYSIFEKMKKLGLNPLIIEYNPETVIKLMHEGKAVVYGDIDDPDLLRSLELKNLEVLVSTIPDVESNLSILKNIKIKNKNLIVILTATQINDALELYKNGADYVIIPHLLGGEHASALIERTYNGLSSILDEKIKHIEELKSRSA